MSIELGADTALKEVQGRTGTSNRWRLMAGLLMRNKGDIPGARATIDQMLADEKSLSPEELAAALSFGGEIYAVPPDPNLLKSKELYKRLLELRPDDVTTLNNLSCNPLNSLDEAMQYSQRAYDLLVKQNVQQPYILDTHGWNLVQAGRVDDGLAVLINAWSVQPFPKLALHVGEGFLKKENASEAERYLTKGQELFDQAVRNKQPTDPRVQDGLTDALRRTEELKKKVRS